MLATSRTKCAAVQRRVSHTRRVARRASTRRAASTTAASSVLVVNTKGGGHSPIGFWLCKKLAEAGNTVTVMVAGAQDDKGMNKPPFCYFDQLRQLGVTTVWGSPDNIAAAVGAGARFDTVVDNNGKDMSTVGPVIDYAKSCGASQFLFVSSCGVYKTTHTPPHVEGDAVKESAGHVQVEQALASSGLQWSSFRPQYISGYGSNKDCEEWFFDRLTRGRPVPIPGSGWQMSNIAHSEDLGFMIALAVGNPEANGHVFNCVNDKGVTLDGMVHLCAEAAGVKDYKIVHYDPDEVGVEVKKAFPFRPVHFYADPRAARRVLGWSATHTYEDFLKARFQEYVSCGRAQADLSEKFKLDDVILAKSVVNA
ncbi:NAD dependent epimerase/dehydratase [Pycnococcus provasolii]|uniref:NAD dependent epimerase/dehydratase n=1 Tax=Pycnococcus provasolii TaxID=41880 RepID=A0A830HMP9_9CHLO|nr:NAD dependent epimerase/dehydratase [Pycnococcus provasolii]